MILDDVLLLRTHVNGVYFTKYQLDNLKCWWL